MRAALQALQIARADLDVALQLLPPPGGDTSIASQELTQVLDRVRTAKHHLEALEGVLAPHVHQ
jgi:hypothetical protein